jgi:hypothetical protein
MDLELSAKFTEISLADSNLSFVVVASSTEEPVSTVKTNEKSNDDDDDNDHNDHCSCAVTVTVTMIVMSVMVMIVHFYIKKEKKLFANEKKLTKLIFF